jgi:transposase-like protein
MTVNNINLTPVQEIVIAAITGGATMKAAAEAASVHRNTISYWRQTSLAFRDALGHAQYDKAIFIREEAECRVTEAFAVIHTILTKPDASDTARLNAAKYIIEKASTPPPPPPEATYSLAEKPEIMHSNAQSGFESPTVSAPPEPDKPEIAHSNAQSGFESQTASAPPEPEKPEIMHSNAQSGFESQAASAPPEPKKPEIVLEYAQSRPAPAARPALKVGRNHPCPCGSHLKFKRCCLGKTRLTVAA